MNTLQLLILYLVRIKHLNQLDVCQIIKADNICVIILHNLVFLFEHVYEIHI